MQDFYTKTVNRKVFTMINEKKYMERLSNKTEDTNAELTLVTDLNVIKKFENDSGKPIGMIDNFPFYYFCLDIYYNRKTNNFFRYCSVEYPNSGAATLVVLQENNNNFFLLNNQYRPFVGNRVLEIPRGFANSNETPLETGLRELFEETNIKIKKANIRSLGKITPDTGLTNNCVSLFLAECEISQTSNLCINDDSEAILNHEIISENKMCKLIKNGTIKDAFTLAAFLRYKLQKEEKI